MFENKKILILGFARSGYDAAKVLIKRKNQVLIVDSKTKEQVDGDKYQELKELGVEFHLGNQDLEVLDSSFDYLIKSPGVPVKHPYVLKAKEQNIEVINEVEVAYRLLPKNVKIVAITGTNGKTTTTSLTYAIVKKAYPSAHLAGNIGYPLCSILDQIQENDILVMEVSCQQLENLITFRPDIAVMTNLYEAHIDFFETYENYKKVKAKLFKNQTNKDIAILNLENKDVLEETKDILSTKKYFSSKQRTEYAYLKDHAIYYKEEQIINVKDMKIVGTHNIENAMAAIMVAKELNISNEIIRDVIMKFTGVAHRLEYVGEVNQVRYFNDTEATNVKCTEIALKSFDEDTILILGGLERGQNFYDLKPFMNHVKAIIGIGECRERVKQFGDDLNIETYMYEHLKDGFQKCTEIAKPGDVVLLSPASASWDQYKQCEDRGDEFKKYVTELEK